MHFVGEMNKQELEGPIQPYVDEKGNVWLCCPSSDPKKPGYWHNTSGNRTIRVFEPYTQPPALGMWRVMIADTSGNEQYFGFDGPQGKQKAFACAADYLPHE